MESDSLHALFLGSMDFCLGQANRTLQPVINEFELAPIYQELTGVIFREDHLQLSLLVIITHEMAHILDFASSLFPYFRDESGEPIMARDADGEQAAISRQCGDGDTHFGQYPSGRRKLSAVYCDSKSTKHSTESF